MIKERYVNFEVAKLLRNKGFNEPCHATYDTAVTGGKPIFSEYEVLSYFPYGMKNTDDKYDMVISAPTQAMACDWLEKQESVEEIVERCKTSWFNAGKIQGMMEGLSDEEKYQQGWHDAIEKQGEQKPIELVNETITIPDGCVATIEDNKIHIKREGKSVIDAIKEEKLDNANKVEPKFKVGDWITDGNITLQIEAIKNDCYLYCGDCALYSIKTADKVYHLWTIADAKDGDVLYHKTKSRIEYIVMNKGLNEHGNINSYFRYNSLGAFGVDIPVVLSTRLDDITPATKERRDFLFQKMKEAGYEWDDEKKELKKI